MSKGLSFSYALSVILRLKNQQRTRNNVSRSEIRYVDRVQFTITQCQLGVQKGWLWLGGLVTAWVAALTCGDP